MRQISSADGTRRPGGIIPLQGGAIIPESPGGIIPLKTGAFIGIGKKFKEFRKQPTLPPGQIGTDEEELISIARSVHRKRGSWSQVPKDLPATADEG